MRSHIRIQWIVASGNEFFDAVEIRIVRHDLFRISDYVVRLLYHQGSDWKESPPFSELVDFLVETLWGSQVHRRLDRCDEWDRHEAADALHDSGYHSGSRAVQVIGSASVHSELYRHTNPGR